MIIESRQISISEIDDIDIFIASSGYEARAIFITTKIYQKAKKKYSLSFENETEDLVRIENDKYFVDKGFKSLLLNAENNYEKTLDYLLRIISVELEKSSKKITVFIDYSSMTKNWYSYILLGTYYMPKNDYLRLIFGYSHSKFECNNNNPTYNKVVQPLAGYCNLSIPNKPTALIIGLGYESERVYGLKEYFDAEPYLFYSNKNYNPEYSEEVEIVHKDLLEEAKPNYVIKYPIYDLNTSTYLIENLCNKLLENHRVIIAPCGPKPFGLLAMIASLRNSESIEVWRISAGNQSQKINREAEGLVTSLEVNFIKN